MNSLNLQQINNIDWSESAISKIYFDYINPLPDVYLLIYISLEQKYCIIKFSNTTFFNFRGFVNAIGLFKTESKDDKVITNIFDYSQSGENDLNGNIKVVSSSIFMNLMGTFDENKFTFEEYIS